MDNYNFESGYTGAGAWLCGLVFWVVFLAVLVVLAWAAGVLVIFEDSSFLINLGGFRLSGCFPFGLCGL